jgi:translocation and assembly module TamB
MVEDFEVELLPSGKESSTYSDVQDYEAALRGVRKWMPSVRLSHGKVKSGGTLVELGGVGWIRGLLNAEVSLPQKGISGMVKGQVNESGSIRLGLEEPHLQFRSEVEVLTNSTGLVLQATNFWRSNQFELRAQFGLKGELPDHATLEAQDFRVPREWVKLQGLYQDVIGTFTIHFTNAADRDLMPTLPSGTVAENKGDQFWLNLSAGAEPVASETSLPPLKIELRAHGGTNAAVIETATVSSPWLRLELLHRLAVDFAGPRIQEPAAVKLSAELEHQPWIPLRGTLSGEGDVGPGPGRFPTGRFHLSGSGIGDGKIKTKDVGVDCSLDWPRLTLKKATASFDDGSSATVSGTLDLEQKRVEEGQVAFNGPIIQQWLPPGYGYQNLAFTARFSGALGDIQHEGRLAVTNCVGPLTQPCQVEVDWTGHQWNISRTEVNLTVTNLSLVARGAASLDTKQLNLETLTICSNDQTVLELTHPFQAVVVPAEPSGPVKVDATSFDADGLAGQIHAELKLDWPTHGMGQVEISQFSPAVLNALLKDQLPQVNIQRLNAWGGWTNGPAVFGADIAAQATIGKRSVLSAANSGTTWKSSLPGGHRESSLPAEERETSAAAKVSGFQRPDLSQEIGIKLSLKGDASGLALTNLSVTSGSAPVAVAHGFLPVSFYPADTSNRAHLEMKTPLYLMAESRPEAFFWDELSKWSGFSLSEPRIDLRLSGSWETPQGEAKVSIAEAQLPQTEGARPTFDDLQLKVEFDRGRARLTQGEVFFQGQPLSLTGDVPLGERFWKQLSSGSITNWEEATAHLQATNIELAAFVELFPKYLAPEGELNLDVSLLPGLKFEGDLTVHNARTRPLETLGPIRHIEVEMNLHNDFLNLEQITASVGGSAVSIGGVAELKGREWTEWRVPPFQMTVYGTNVPLSRQPESIIRSDLQLAVTKTNDAPPVITGVVRLRDSVYLSDLSDLVPGGVASPRRRPPYFSIDDPNLADWRLHARVEGPHFLRVRSSLFSGQVSADMNLQGTLGEPLVIGDVRIDSGIVRFPFANLEVQQGIVSLASQDPYHPHLTVSATSKQFGYDIRMTASGPVDAPVLQFSSTPPLSSEQILLLVTAGKLPSGEYNLSAQQRAQTVGLFLGRDLLTRLGFGDETEQRLTIQSGEEISEQGRPTYHVEIKITDKWYVFGEYDRFGDYNGGVKWRIYSK